MQTLEIEIVRCARTWIGTRFHHQGRLKRTASHKGGVDCLGLLAGVAAELGLKSRTGEPLAALDRADYGHLPDGAALHAALGTHLYPAGVSGMRSNSEAIAHLNIPPGGILLISLDGVPRHLAIASDYHIPGGGICTGMIHAYAQARKVVEHRLDEGWQSKICAVFRVPPQ